VIRKSLVLAAVLLAIPFAIAACGDDDDEETTPAASETTAEETTTEATTAEDGGGGDTGGGETISVSETEFALDPPDGNAAAGPVTIEVTNDGQTVHNLEVEGNGIAEITSDLQPGDSDTLELELDPGTYRWYCAIGDHAAQGMDGELTVE
jgi:plastocyanin